MARLPPQVAASGARRERELDVRSVLAKGGDPFHLILQTAEALGEDEALHLIVGFEPAPLYSVMKSRGRSAYTERADGAYHVWFYRDTGPSAAKSAAAGGPAPREALLPPVEVDVRGLEPPEPMIAILQKLAELGPGAQLLVQHHREPVLLYEKLALRGYRARTTRRGESDYLVHIAPAWAFEGI